MFVSMTRPDFGRSPWELKLFNLRPPIFLALIAPLFRLERHLLICCNFLSFLPYDALRLIRSRFVVAWRLLSLA